MPIDPSKALGASLGEGQVSYTKDDVILYHLGPELETGMKTTTTCPGCSLYWCRSPWPSAVIEPRRCSSGTTSRPATTCERPCGDRRSTAQLCQPSATWRLLLQRERLGENRDKNETIPGKSERRLAGASQ